MAHASTSGLMKCGVEVHLAKLNPEKVRAIRMLKGVAKAKEVAPIFGITPGPIYAIWRGRTWKQVV